jgi:His/Glu/Gln/Arg/opine family amino acid ABC transporter permease subunit
MDKAFRGEILEGVLKRELEFIALKDAALSLPAASTATAVSLVGGYVQLFQGTPLLMQLFLFFFGIALFGIEVSPWTAATLALTLWTSAFLTEIVPYTVDIEQVISNTAPSEGDALTLTLTLTNRSMSSITDIFVQDALPAGLRGKAESIAVTA